MIGTNTLELNEATMREALQQWIDGTIKVKPPRVTAVESVSSGYGSKTFKVTLAELEVSTVGATGNAL